MRPLRIRVAEGDGGPSVSPARIEEAHLQTDTVDVDLRELIDSAVATLHAVARRKGIGVAVRVEADGPVHLDSKLVRRAIEDLLGNALKYTPSGLDISVTARQDAGAVVFEVADRGPGIPAEMRAAMLAGSMERNGSGAHQSIGLGLYMVELVARGHGGKLEILDRDGGGAVVRLQLRSDAAAENRNGNGSS